MLLINKTLIKMSKGVRIWIFIIALLKMLTLIGTVLFAQTISAFLGDLYQPSLSKEELIGAIVSAVFASLLINFSYSFKDMNYSETYKEFNL